MQQRNLYWIFKFRVHKSKVQVFHDPLLVKEQTLQRGKVLSLYNSKASVEFLQKTKGIQYADSIWLSSVLILTKTGCVREFLYQSTTVSHPVLSLKSDRTGVSHRHWGVHYVVVFSHSLPYLPRLSDWYLTQFLSWDYDSDHITSFYFSEGKSLPYSSLWLGSASNWMDSLYWGKISYTLNSWNAHCPFWGRLVTAPAFWPQLIQPNLDVLSKASPSIGLSVFYEAVWQVSSTQWGKR